MLPLPALLDHHRPDWLALVVLYWVIALPHRVNIGTAWVSGLLLDIVFGSTLGVHALSMAIMAYVVALQFQKIRNFSVWQQALVTCASVCSASSLCFGRNICSGWSALNYRLFWTSLSTLVLWPAAFLLLRRLRRRLHIR